MASDYLFPSVHGSNGLLTLTGNEVLTVAMLGMLVDLAGHELNLAALAEDEYGTLFITGPGTVIGGVEATLGENGLFFVAVNGSEFDYMTSGDGGPVSTGDLVTEPGNGNAAAGKLGEYVESAETDVDLVNYSAATAASIILGPGDWDVDGVVRLSPDTASVSVYGAGLSITESVPSGLRATAGYPGTSFESIPFRHVVPRRRFSLAVATTIRLVAIASFSEGTVNAAGLMSARRVR